MNPLVRINSAISSTLSEGTLRYQVDSSLLGKGLPGRHLESLFPSLGFSVWGNLKSSVE